MTTVYADLRDANCGIQVKYSSLEGAACPGPTLSQGLLYLDGELGGESK
jgi:hypothetical protein